MSSRYNVRNVAQKQVYDSYMGILRISPVSVGGKDFDDVTSLLNSLYDFNQKIDVQGDETRDANFSEYAVYLRLTDSDGNRLPIKFVPKAFNQTVTIRESNTDITHSSYPVINIATDVDNFLFVSNKLTARSTINLSIDDTNYSSKSSLLQIASKGQIELNPNNMGYKLSAKSLLFYPIEAPNDQEYYNNKNELPLDEKEQNGGAIYLWDRTNTKPRHEQVKENLHKQPSTWYEQNFPFDTVDGEIQETSKHRVKVNDRFINTYNNKGEQIPVLHTRDYVLGHYDGHSWKNADSSEAFDFQDVWTGTASKLKEITDYDDITKLSWIRFDDLVWQSLDEILKGNVRHTKGRYSDLGNSMTSGTNIWHIFNENEGDIARQSITNNAPLLGTGVEAGLIMYHAMPFHRYWFHRCRQAVQNLKRRVDLTSSAQNEDWDNYLKDENNYISENLIEYSKEASQLQTFYNSNLITPATIATLSPTHSLSKDYLLCNGLDVCFENYPNISPTNENLFVTKNGQPVDITDGKYRQRTNHDYNTLSEEVKNEMNKHTPEKYNHNNIYKAMQKSIPNPFCHSTTTNVQDNDRIYLPNLFSLTEKAPRLIRGLDWCIYEKNTNYDSQICTEKDHTNVNEQHPQSSHENSGADNIKMIYYPSEKFLGEDTDECEFVEDIWGNPGSYSFQRNFGQVALHYYNYDHLTESSYHKHKLFSSNPGVKGSNEDLSKCYYYDYDANNGGNTHLTWSLKNTINRNFLFNDIEYHSRWAGAKERTVSTKKTGGLYSLFRQPKSNSSTVKVDNWDRRGWLNEKSKEWLDYCFKKKSKQLFYNFTPTPNVGLFLFNGDVYNDIVQKHLLTYVYKKENDVVKSDIEVQGGITDKKHPFIVYYKQYTEKEKGVWYPRYKDKNDKETIILPPNSSATWEENKTKKVDVTTLSPKLLHTWIVENLPSNIEYQMYKEWYHNKRDQADKEKQNKNNKNNPSWIPHEIIPYPSKAFSLVTMSKKSTTEDAISYLNSYMSKILTMKSEKGALYGTIRGTISENEMKNWQDYTYYDAQKNPHDFSSSGAFNNGGEYVYKQGDGQDVINENYEALKKHAQQKQRRRMLLMKLNESEAMIPISYIGKAQFSARYVFTYERKRSWLSSTFKGDDWDTETEQFTMKYVGNYEISSYKKSNDSEAPDAAWRCLSSLAYTNPEYLGFGIIGQEYDPEKSETYWNTHNVTDFYRDDNSIHKKSFATYGEKANLEIHTEAPYPSHIKLLPLIRI